MELSPFTLPNPTFRIAVITDLQGYLEPCGCQSRPLGGIDKLSHVIAEERTSGLPTTVLAAGDLLFGSPHHNKGFAPEASQTQNQWKAETLAKILHDLGLVAAAPGTHDLEQQSAFEAARTTACGENRCFEALADRTAQTWQVGANKIAFIGLRATSVGEDQASFEVAVKKLRDEGAHFIVAMGTGSRRDQKRTAIKAKVDALILGGLDDKNAEPPATEDGPIILHAGKQGQGVILIDVQLGTAGAGPFRDVSMWSRQAESTRLQNEITSLSQRITAWKREGAAPQEVAAQEARVAALVAQRAALVPAPTVSTTERAFSARWVELGPEVAGAPQVAATIDAYDRRVNEHNRTALAGLVPVPAAAGQASYVGSETCGSCHAQALAWWKNTPHGNAYATLVSRDKQFNLSCVACHVTGYGQPGGSTVTHVDKLQNVGCENCHGPGSLHIANPTAPMVREVREPVCAGCHTEEHSDQFAFAAYVARLRAPGHAAQ